MVLAFFLYQAASAAVVQGDARAAHPGHHRRRHHGPRARRRSPPTLTLLDAQEQFFLRYRWPWFAVVDPARHFLGVVREQRVDAEIAAGRPALPVADVLEEDLPVRIGEEAAAGIAAGLRGPGPAGGDGRGRRATACCRASSRWRRCAGRCGRPPAMSVRAGERARRIGAPSQHVPPRRHASTRRPDHRRRPRRPARGAGRRRRRARAWRS